MAEARSQPVLRSSFYQRDSRLFLVLIPCINALNYYLTYAHIPPGWLLPITFLIDTAQGYAAWWAIRRLIQYLDVRMSYDGQLLRRIILQCLLTSGAGLLVIIVATEGVNFLATDRPVPRSFYTFDLFIFFIWMLVVNGMYVGAHFYDRFRLAEQTSQQLVRVRQEGFVVRLGRQQVAVPFEEISGFYVDGDYTMLLTNGTKRYVLDQSLDKLEQELPPEWFFRLNRQYILHRQSLTAFDRLENGKLTVQLKPLAGLPSDVPISRTKAPAFKKWFSPPE